MSTAVERIRELMKAQRGGGISPDRKGRGKKGPDTSVVAPRSDESDEDNGEATEVTSPTDIEAPKMASYIENLRKLAALTDSNMLEATDPRQEESPRSGVKSQPERLRQGRDKLTRQGQETRDRLDHGQETLQDTTRAMENQQKLAQAMQGAGGQVDQMLRQGIQRPGDSEKERRRRILKKITGGGRGMGGPVSQKLGSALKKLAQTLGSTGQVTGPVARQPAAAAPPPPPPGQATMPPAAAGQPDPGQATLPPHTQQATQQTDPEVEQQMVEQEEIQQLETEAQRQAALAKILEAQQKQKETIQKMQGGQTRTASATKGLLDQARQRQIGSLALSERVSHLMQGVDGKQASETRRLSRIEPWLVDWVLSGKSGKLASSIDDRIHRRAKKVKSANLDEYRQLLAKGIKTAQSLDKMGRNIYQQVVKRAGKGGVVQHAVQEALRITDVAPVSAAEAWKKASANRAAALKLDQVKVAYGDGSKDQSANKKRKKNVRAYSAKSASEARKTAFQLSQDENLDDTQRSRALRTICLKFPSLYKQANVEVLDRIGGRAFEDGDQETLARCVVGLAAEGALGEQAQSTAIGGLFQAGS